MYRFKASKYKNSFAKIPKKEDSWTDIKVETPLCFGNHVAAGAQYVACNIGSADSGKVAVFDVAKYGRMGAQPSLPAHGAAVTDIEFSPFHHNLLLTASEDTTVKLWQIPREGLTNQKPLHPFETFSGFSKRPEVLRHHSIAENLVGIATGNEIQIWDFQSTSSTFSQSCGSLIQSISWSQDGKVVACATKEKALKIVDPRAGAVVEEGQAHQNHKDSRILFLGGTDKLLTTGFSSSRTREIKVWDQRSLKSSLQTMVQGSSTGVLMPFYDADTKLLFVAGKGESSMLLLEVTDGAEIITQASQASLSDQTKGMALGSKLALEVMGCEVDRIFQLCAKQLIPIKIEVPRRSHIDFAADIFPETFSDQVVLSAEQWCTGDDAVRKTTSLNPSKRKPLQSDTSSGDRSKVITPKSSQIKNDVQNNDSISRAISNPAQVKVAASVNGSKQDIAPPASDAANCPTKPFAGVKQSKFRHSAGTVLHPSTHITNLPSLSRNVSSACDGFHVNRKYAAVPLASGGGPVGVLDLSKVGRAPAEIPNFQNKSAVTDFKWSPFYEEELAVGLDTGVVKVWNVPKEGISGAESSPNVILEGHYSKVLCVQYHPLAMDVLASASTDMNVIIWNIESNEMPIQLSGHDEEILHMAWSENGKYLATVAKDSKLRIYDPRESSQPISSGPGPQGSRGARIAWIHDDTMLFVSGFLKNGNRQISVHFADDLEAGPKESLNFSASPSTLVPYYDHDTNVVFLTGKGDTTVSSYEVTTQPPYFYSAGSFNSDQTHQGFCFMSKLACDVRRVEFAKAWRLSKNSMEQVSFKVPRVKMEYFQDDIFPPTRDRTKSTMTADDWFSGQNIEAVKVSVQPSDMKPLSEAPKEAPKQRKYESYNASTYKTDEEKKEELLAAMSTKLDLDKKLEQDMMEGVDEDEWDD